jgi:hypothetical protein
MPSKSRCIVLIAAASLASLQENSDAILLKAAVTILAECEGDLLVQEVRAAGVHRAVPLLRCVGDRASGGSKQQASLRLASLPAACLAGFAGHDRSQRSHSITPHFWHLSAGCWGCIPLCVPPARPAPPPPPRLPGL